MNQNKTPTNDVLLAKIEGFRDLVEQKFIENKSSHDSINEHLKDLNGQVAKNSKFRTEGKIYFGVAMFVISALVTIFTTLINKIL